MYTGRRKALTSAQVEQIAARAASGEAKAALAREFGVSRETLYQHLRARQQQPAAVAQ